jgi:hypothetical protein
MHMRRAQRDTTPPIVVPASDVLRSHYNHFFHLNNTYGSTAASSIMTSAIG